MANGRSLRPKWKRLQVAGFDGKDCSEGLMKDGKGFDGEAKAARVHDVLNPRILTADGLFRCLQRFPYGYLEGS